MNLPIVAIVGRPNVGKSTLFNRLVGRRIAVVHDEPGVTRDRNYARIDWNRRHFFIVDTGGMVTAETASAILKDIRRQAEVAIEEADLVLVVVDGQLAPATEDLELAKQLYRHSAKVMLVANKMDDEHDEWNAGEWMKLGLGEPQPVSALQGRSVGDLLSAVARRLPAMQDDIDPGSSIRVAVVGRPNVGKSSLVNALLRNERMVVAAEPGTTRDAIDTELVVDEQRYTLVDTAGLRRKARVKDPTEFFSSVRTRQSLERSDVALFLIDASVPISTQDVHVAAEISDARRAAILVFNKWDLVDVKATNTARDMEQDARDRLTFMEYAPAVFLSALTRQRVNKLFPLIRQVYQQATRKFTTGELNRWLEKIQKIAPAPANRSGIAPRIYYATQTGHQPPTITLFVNHPRAMAPNYMRFLQNQMRDEWGLSGTPIHLRVRQSK